jgi:hypothetical protein
VEIAINCEIPTKNGLGAGKEKSCVAQGQKRDNVWVCNVILT